MSEVSIAAPLLRLGAGRHQGACHRVQVHWPLQQMPHVFRRAAMSRALIATADQSSTGGYSRKCTANTRLVRYCARTASPRAAACASDGSASQPTFPLGSGRLEQRRNVTGGTIWSPIRPDSLKCCYVVAHVRKERRSSGRARSNRVYAPNNVSSQRIGVVHLVRYARSDSNLRAHVKAHRQRGLMHDWRLGQQCQKPILVIRHTI